MSSTERAGVRTAERQAPRRSARTDGRTALCRGLALDQGACRLPGQGVTLARARNMALTVDDPARTGLGPTVGPRRTARALALGLIFLVVGGLAGAKAAPPIRARSDAIDRGRSIVQRDCASCHAVGPNGDSPNPKAPRFRQLHERYDVEALGEALAEGLTVGHGPMPEWSFGPSDTAAILAYLKSLEAPEKDRSRRARPGQSSHSPTRS